MMLVAIFAAVGLGTFAGKFGRRESMLVVAIAATLVLVYFLRPYYMT
jgi:hypothetical protein